MANIPNTDSKLVWVKAMARGQCFPLDATEVWTALGDATTEGTATYYAKNDPTAYVGQTLKVVENGEVAVYVISNDAGDLTKLADAQAVADAIGAIDGFATEEYVNGKFNTLVGDEEVSLQISKAIEKIDFPVDKKKLGALIDKCIKLHGLSESAEPGKGLCLHHDPLPDSGWGNRHRPQVCCPAGCECAAGPATHPG